MLPEGNATSARGLPDLRLPNESRAAGIVLRAALLLTFCMMAFAVALAVPRAVNSGPCHAGLTSTISPPALTAAPLVDLADADDDDAIDADDGGDASLVHDDLPTAVIAPVLSGRQIRAVPSRLLPADVRIGFDTPRAPPYPSHIG